MRTLSRRPNFCESERANAAQSDQRSRPGKGPTAGGKGLGFLGESNRKTQPMLEPRCG